MSTSRHITMATTLSETRLLIRERCLALPGQLRLGEERGEMVLGYWKCVLGVGYVCVCSAVMLYYRSYRRVSLRICIVDMYIAKKLQRYGQFSNSRSKYVFHQIS